VTPTPPCSATMYCQVQYSSGTPVGGKCKVKIASGMPCDPKNDDGYNFAENQCVDGTTCYTTGVAGSETCHAFGSLDADCKASFGTLSTCKQGLWCDTTTSPGKCKAFLSNGTACPAGNKHGGS